MNFFQKNKPRNKRGLFSLGETLLKNPIFIKNRLSFFYPAKANKALQIKK